MKDGRDPGRELEQELAEEAALKARMHRYMGLAAAILGGVAIVVALARMRTMFGVSPLEALGLGATALPWVLLILGVAVFLSLMPRWVMLLQNWQKRRTGK